MRPREAAALVALAALWGASFLFIRIAAPALGPFPLMAGRVLLAALALWGLAAARRTRIVFAPYWKRLLLLGLCHAAVPFALVAAAEVHLSASQAAVLLAVQPLFTALLGTRFGERMTARRALGLGLGVAGVAVLVGWTPSGFDRATLLASAAVLAAAFLYAAGTVYSHRRLGDVPILTLALGQQLAAAAWLALPALVTLPHARFEPGALAAMLALAVLSTAVAYQIFFWLVARVGAVHTAQVNYLIPLFGILWGATFLGEPVGAEMAVGFAAVLASLVLVGRTAGKPTLATETRFRRASTSPSTERVGAVPQ